MQDVSDSQVAVVIPVYGAEYLEESLASVFGQTRSPDQVIVIDDGSPHRHRIDGAVRRWGSRVTLIRQDNCGAAAARNRGILATRATLIAFLDADDLWHPAFLEEQMRRMERVPPPTLVYANARIIGSGPLVGQLFMDGAPSSGDVTVESLLAQRCTVLTSSVVARRQALIAAGLFDVDLRRGQDFDMWVRMAHRGARFEYTTAPLVERRIHLQNLSGDTLSALERAVAVLEKLSTKIVFSRPERRALDERVRILRGRIHAEHGKRSLKSGDLEHARLQFREALTAATNWKLQLVNAALHVAPGLIRQAYLLKSRLLTGVQP